MRIIVLQESIKTGLSAADWAQIIAAIGTVVAAAMAVYAAVQSRRSSRENRILNDSMTRPRISIFVQSTAAAKNFIDLIVSNDGHGLARNISFKVEGDDLDLDHQLPHLNKLSQLRVIQQGIKTLSPGDRRNYYILSVIGKYEEIMEKQTTIHVEYEGDSKREPYKDSFVLDFSSLSESGWRSEDERALANITNELKKIAKGINNK